MIKIFARLGWLVTAAICLATQNSGAWQEGGGNWLYLRDGWKIQTSAQLSSDGKALSSDAFVGAGWHSASVPATVLGALVDDGTYRDIYVGKNLAAIPTNQFTVPWWYRTEIEVNTEQAAQNATLIFEGINYRANVWLNGERIAVDDETFGAFRTFNFDITGRLKRGKNTLAVEVLPPRPGDFTMGFVDWNPKPPDANMGLFRPVKIHFYKTVALENIFVESQIDHANWRQARLLVHADVINHSDQVVQALLKGDLDGVTFNEAITLQPQERRAIKLNSTEHRELYLPNARLWWPWELGEPNLYTFKLNCLSGGEVLDEREVRFGVREVSDYVNPQGYRGYRVNGKRVLIRGGGWADELLLRENAANLAAQISYTRDMNLNTIRLEGVWGSSQRLYDLADENGLLVMVGWSCQWEWSNYLGKKADKKYGGFTTDADMQLATNYLHDQVFWLRNHPSIYVWVLGSDMLPQPELERKYDSLLAVIDPTRPSLKTCGSGTSEVSGPSRVKMEGPYDYVTPNYWYLDRTHGGAYGFNTETGPGPQPPPLESLKKMFPDDQLWPVNATWNYHCGRGEFGSIDRYLRDFNQRYGEAKSVEDFAARSQAVNYEAIRPMYEAFSANLPRTTGIIQWMLNPSWPKLYWQLYDYYLLPGGTYFGAKKGASPFSAVYNYGDGGIYLVNQVDAELGDLQTTIAVYDLNSKKIFETNITATCPVFGSKKIFDLKAVSPGTPVYFVDLHLTTASGTPAGDNFYWLSTKPDVLDEERSDWYFTPNKSFADFTALQKLAPAQVKADVIFTPSGNGVDAEVALANSGTNLAFFVEMSLLDPGTKATLVPVLWTDNYVSLPPGAKRIYKAHLPATTGTDKPQLRVRGWNVAEN